jgi:hypothetical protein
MKMEGRHDRAGTKDDSTSARPLARTELEVEDEAIGPLMKLHTLRRGRQQRGPVMSHVTWGFNASGSEFGMHPRIAPGRRRHY